MSQSSAVYRRGGSWPSSPSRRSVAVIVFALTQLTGSDAAEPPSRAGGADEERAEATPTPEPPPELPRGGRRILPDFRVVAYYGAPQDDELGALGIGSPTAMTRKLERAAKPFDRKSRPGAARDGADRGRRGGASGPGRPLQPAPAGLGHPPLPEGRAQGQVAADPGHPARPLGLLHRDQAAAQVAQGARRRARAGPRVADGPGRGPRRRDRQRDRTRGQRHHRLAGPARQAREPARRSCS